jgi:hypothetical protein
MSMQFIIIVLKQDIILLFMGTSVPKLTDNDLINLDKRENKICYGVYNQRNVINNFSMYLKVKGATLILSQ